jgi:hypothetical protein
VQAQAVRDDGARGVVLRFLDVSEDAARALAEVLEGPPQIEASGGDGGRALVVGELVEG